MTSDASTPQPAQAPCPRCNAPAAVTSVRTAIWRDESVGSVVVVEDIPALVCTSCQDQFYSDDVSDALRTLMEQGFPSDAETRRIEVPVFSLKGRVRERVALPEDTMVD